ncbi:MAG: glycosyltransferase [Patescibacteria group bacterium]
MTILFATDHYPPHVNGIVRHVIMLQDELRKRGHRVLILTPRVTKTQKTGDDIFYLPSVKTYTHADDALAVPYNRKLEQQILALKPDIVHSHLFFSGFMATRIAKKLKIPSVVTIHTFVSQYFAWMLPRAQAFTRPIADAVTRNYYNRFDLILAPSLKAVDELEHAHVSAKIDHFPNAIDQKIAQKITDKDFYEKWDINPRHPLSIIVGSLEKAKNIDVAIKSWALVVRKFPEAHLAILGDGTQRPALEKMTAELQLQNNIIFTGFVDPNMIASANHAADVVFFTSDTDNFPTVLIEALTAHKPIVAVDDKAVVDLVIPGKNGELAPKDPVMLAEKICDLLSDDVKRLEYGKESAKMAKQFSIEEYVNKLEDIYTNLITAQKNS